MGQLLYGTPHELADYYHHFLSVDKNPDGKEELSSLFRSFEHTRGCGVLQEKDYLKFLSCLYDYLASKENNMYPLIKKEKMIEGWAKEYFSSKKQITIEDFKLFSPLFIQSSRPQVEDTATKCRVIPLRITPKERFLLDILLNALEISEYTDHVDAGHLMGMRRKTIKRELREMLSFLAGLYISQNQDDTKIKKSSTELKESAAFFRQIFEIGRRYKILNPEKMRTLYGKLMFMLQDHKTVTLFKPKPQKEEIDTEENLSDPGDKTPSKESDTETPGAQKTPVQDRDKGIIPQFNKTSKTKPMELEEEEDTNLISPILNIYDFLKDKNSLKLLESEDFTKATQIVKTTHTPNERESIKKNIATSTANLIRDYTSDTLRQEDIMLAIDSYKDYNASLYANLDSIDKIIQYLHSYFHPFSESITSLAISQGYHGSCLTHSHAEQFQFVHQTLQLWKEIQHHMNRLWLCADYDLLAEQSYSLVNTGQGINRMQSASSVAKSMSAILSIVKKRVGDWVGLSVVHLGDRDVPNALVFIDKYTQVPRILNPIIRAIETAHEISQDPERALFLIEFGGLESLCRTILGDFFRHGFDD